MRVLFFSVLFAIFSMILPLSAQAAAGPEGHDHGEHEHAAPKPEDHSEHNHAADKPENGEHDHAAHTWQAPEEEQKRPNPVSSSTESIARGERLFQHYCISCHGYKADGDTMRGKSLNPKAANLREMAGHHTDGDYHYKIRTGHGPMPGWGGVISKENIWHLVNYLQALTPPEGSAGGGGHQHHHPQPEAASEKPDHHDHSTHKH